MLIVGNRDWMTSPFYWILQGFEEILMPGEPETRCEQQRRVEGVPLQEDVVRTLKSVATTTLTTATQRVRGSRDQKMLITFVAEIPSVDG